MKIETIGVVSEEDRRRTSAIDLLSWHEEKVLTQLVRDVYKAGLVGETWPTVQRIPVCMVGGELVPCRPQDAAQWRIVARVEAVLR